MLSEKNGTYFLENDTLQVAIDGKTGYISTVANKTAGADGTVFFSYKDANSGAWPFYLEYLHPSYGEVKTVSISKDSRCTVTDSTISESDGLAMLTLHYADLALDDNGDSTGIAADVIYKLEQNASCFTFQVALDLTATEGRVYSLHLVSSGALSTGDGQAETLTAPVWGSGTKWKNPVKNDAFLKEKTLSYPGVNDTSLECGWLDLSGENGGIGIAYIDASEMIAEFRVVKDGGGMSMEIVLFDPEMVLGKHVSLLPGEIFHSNEILVSVHSGTWHQTADDYRTAFHAAFTNEDGTPDYLTAETLSTAADGFWYFLREIGNFNGTGTGNLSAPATFSTMWQNVRKLSNELNLQTEHTFLWLVGINEGTYGKDVPHLFPLNEQLADSGSSALASFRSALIDGYVGAGGNLLLYTHPFAMDCERADLTALFSLIDPQQHTENWDAGKHHSVCNYNDNVYSLWEETLLEEYRLLGAGGVQFDQASLVQTVCDMEGHSHGPDTVSRLSAAVKGTVSLSKLVREQLCENAYIVSEATNDLTCRYIDIRQNHWLHFSPKWNGEFEYGTTMYTHPQYVYLNLNYVSDGKGGMKEFYLQSAVLGGPVLLTDGTTTPVKREAIRFVTDLRTNEVPGYPHGYRDTLGLTISDNALFARVYVEGNRISLLYCAEKRVKDATVTLDLEALGFADAGSRTLHVSIAGNKAGYQIIEVND